jgi:hypothetical protein
MISTKDDSMIGARISKVSEKTVLQIGIFLCLIFAINGLVVQFFELPLHILKSVNEGFNAYFARRAMDGIILYPRPPEMLMNNYPPLSFYIIGPLGKLMGDYIIAGRIISVVSFLAIVALLGYIVARHTRSRRIGIFAASRTCGHAGRICNFVVWRWSSGSSVVRRGANGYSGSH